jgi:hypothetical protein
MKIEMILDPKIDWRKKEQKRHDKVNFKVVFLQVFRGLAVGEDQGRSCLGPIQLLIHMWWFWAVDIYTGHV